MRRRASPALALAIFATTVGLLTFAVTPPSSSDEPVTLALSSLSFQLLIALLAAAGALLSPRRFAERLGLGRGRLGGPGVGLLVLGTIAVSHGVDGVLELSGLREQSVLAELEATVTGVRGGTLALVLVGLGLAPGIGEELLCRGFLQRGLETRLGSLRAVLVSAAIFGLLHIDPVHAAAATVLGLYLGLGAALAGSTRAAILCHSANNLLALVSLALLPELSLHGLGSSLLGFAVAAGCLGWVWRSCGGLPGAPQQPALQPQAGSDDP